MRPYVWVEKEEARVGATDTCAIHSLNLHVPSGPTQAAQVGTPNFMVW